MIITILKFICFVPLSFCITLASWLVAPVAPLFRNSEYRLPSWLAWCSTPHTNLLGDPDHQRRWAGKSQYIQMVAWIFRNPGCVGQREWLGYKPNEGDTYSQYGNPKTSDGVGGESGFLRIYAHRASGRICAFQWYLVQEYPFARGHALRVLLGWKIWNKQKITEPCQITCLIQPWKTFGTSK